jgi:DNA polymerase-3 subunit epsilon
MLPCFVVLDLETTGGNAVQDRITEIAAVRIENGAERARWSTLVNPHTGIPPFIQSLTGITDAMVQTAPDFSEVANTLLGLLKGAVLVAHNVRFDHGFLLQAFARMGIALKVKTLCTVRLSRTLYPQHKGHGLDAILRRHGLHTQARHRAMGDVDVVLQWLDAAKAELGNETVAQAAQCLLQGSASVPPLLETPLSDIPDSPGVYLFYGEGTLPLYIGKSVKLRSRVMAHFQAASRNAREMRILTEIRRVEWRQTAGELGALLLESRLVKALQPVYNRQLRRQRGLLAWQVADDPGARPLLQLVRLDDMANDTLPKLYGVYRSKRHAQDSLRTAAQAHGLCPQALGLESGKAACFAHQIGQCRGLCAGRESSALHAARLGMALAAQRLQAWPHAGRVGIREYHAPSGRSEIHVFDQWCHLATVQNEAELHALASERRPMAFDLDTYRLLVKRLSAPRGQDRTMFLIGAPHHVE